MRWTQTWTTNTYPCGTKDIAVCKNKCVEDQSAMGSACCSFFMRPTTLWFWRTWLNLQIWFVQSQCFFSSSRSSTNQGYRRIYKRIYQSPTPHCAISFAKLNNLFLFEWSHAAARSAFLVSPGELPPISTRFESVGPLPGRRSMFYCL